MNWRNPTVEASNKLTLPDGWLPTTYYDALNVLFRIENALRIFVYIVLKNVHGAKWQALSVTSDDNRAGSIASVARQRVEQDSKYGYLGDPSTCPLMYLTSGELVRLMFTDDQWPHFSGHFVATKELIRVKLEEIGNVRNALAHFRALTRDDVELVKYNAKHVLVEVEHCLEQVMGCTIDVPTNTPAKWYKGLRSMSAEPFEMAVKQSANEEWIAVVLAYPCPIVRPSAEGGFWLNYGVLTIMTSGILRHFEELGAYVTYVAEGMNRARVREVADARFGKVIQLVFGRAMLEKAGDDIARIIGEIVKKVGEETELISQEDSARGDLVRLVNVMCESVESGDKKRWKCDTGPLRCPVGKDDLPEYWGGLRLYFGGDWISSATVYPWMPRGLAMVVSDEFPF